MDKTLADEIAGHMASPRRMPGHAIIKDPAGRKRFEAQAAKVLSLLTRANRFTLGEDFTQAATVISKFEDSSKLEDIVALARCPFPVTWVEWPAGARARKQREIGTLSGDPIADAKDGDLDGFLITQKEDDPRHYAVMYCSNRMGGADEPNEQFRIGVADVLYLMDTSGEDFWESQPESAFPSVKIGSEAESARMSQRLRMIPWGTAKLPDVRPDEDKQIRLDEIDLQGTDRMLRSCALGVSPFFVEMTRDVVANGHDQEKAVIQKWVDELWEGRGDIRWLCTILAMLNEIPNRVGAPVRKQGTYLAAGKVRTYMSSRVVTLDYPSDPVPKILKALRRASGDARRRHEVRGHWRTRVGKDGPFRVWVRSHMRGDATKGFIQHAYEATAGRDASDFVPSERAAPIRDRDPEEEKPWHKTP